MGWNDHVGLSPQGRRDALTTAKKLQNYQINAAYHSDLLRTRETAEIISRHLKIHSTPNQLLRERDLGNFANLTPHQIMLDRPDDWSKFIDHHDITWNGLNGESLHHVHQRIAKLRTTLKKHHAGATVLLITHSGLIHIMLRDHFGFFPKESFIDVAHDSITLLEKRVDRYHLALHNHI